MANDLRQYQRIKDAYEEMPAGRSVLMVPSKRCIGGCTRTTAAGTMRPRKLAKAMREKREKILEEYESELNLLREKYQDVFEEHGIEIEEGIGTLPLRRVSRQG
jgi:hypothetical protein